MADGHLGKCKDCTRSDSNKYRDSNLEKIKSQDRERDKLPHRIAQRKQYQKTEAFRESCNESNLRWYRRNTEKKYAHTLVQRAIKKGKLVKGSCEKCGTTEKIVAHHEDYSKPLEVVWLCNAHHKEHHRRYP
jgi:hypothetical protein